MHTRFHAYGALSRREFQILIRMADGDSDKETAAALHLDVSSVRTYIRRGMTKLGARSRPNAVKLLYELGLLRPL